MTYIYQNLSLHTPVNDFPAESPVLNPAAGIAAPIPVTRSSLPPLSDYIPLLEQIWASRHLTNNGTFHQQLEEKLKEYLGVPYISLFSSCTSALVAALKLLDLRGEVITTPYTFVATAHALIWCNLKPVFVDIDPLTANIDPAEIEKAITPNTCAILAVHCYGQVCDTESIDRIARKHHLKVIYDAAHAFGVEDHAGSILNTGDFSTISFHAAKVFNTAEGGALICHDKETKDRIDRFKNFGFASETSMIDVGFNGKMSELSAALGIAQLGHIDRYFIARQKADHIYRELLCGVRGLEPFAFHNLKRANYSYFPVRVTKAFPLSRDQLHEEFRAKNIYTRRYFYPVVTDFIPYRDMGGNTPVAKCLADEVLCLPLYEGLTEGDQKRIFDILFQLSVKR